MNYKRLGTITALAGLTLTATACGDDDNVTSESTTVVTAESSAETTEPEPTVPDTTVPDSTDPEPAGPATSESAVTDPSSSAPADCAEEPTEEAAEGLLVGLTEEEATDAAEACGWTLRVLRRDGEDLPATLDLRPDRVNVEVTDDEVTAIINIG